ncbi:MAG: hypothetical protein AB7U20_12980, partial [Planctomycetaceae bacterium]
MVDHVLNFAQTPVFHPVRPGAADRRFRTAAAGPDPFQRHAHGRHVDRDAGQAAQRRDEQLAGPGGTPLAVLLGGRADDLVQGGQVLVIEFARAVLFAASG